MKTAEDTQRGGRPGGGAMTHFFRSLSFLRLPPTAMKGWFWQISEVAFFLEKEMISSSRSLLFSSSFPRSSWWTRFRCSNLACSWEAEVQVSPDGAPAARGRAQLGPRTSGCALTGTKQQPAPASDVSKGRASGRSYTRNCRSNSHFKYGSVQKKCTNKI